jgi:hypothetical protein
MGIFLDASLPLSTGNASFVQQFNPSTGALVGGNLQLASLLTAAWGARVMSLNNGNYVACLQAADSQYDIQCGIYK